MDPTSTDNINRKDKVNEFDCLAGWGFCTLVAWTSQKQWQQQRHGLYSCFSQDIDPTARL